MQGISQNRLQQADQCFNLDRTLCIGPLTGARLGAINGSLQHTLGRTDATGSGATCERGAGNADAVNQDRQAHREHDHRDRAFPSPEDVCPKRQKNNDSTWHLAKIAFAMRGIDAQVAHGDVFRKSGSPGLKAAYFLAESLVIVRGWRGKFLREDKQWKDGVPALVTPVLVGAGTLWSTLHLRASLMSRSAMARSH